MAKQQVHTRQLHRASDAVAFREPPKVRLINTFQEPYNNAVATARTCYASRVIEAQDVDKDDRARKQRDAIAQSIYAAGHHTTLQHAHFQFVLENVSRQCIWSFLHAHPFYNSEQVSQRYVAVRPERALIPQLANPTAQQRYEEMLQAQMACYQELVQLLDTSTTQEYLRIFPGRQKKPDETARAVRKKTQEVARYILPIATYAHLYHTISGLTLHRYHRLCEMLDTPHETRLVVRAMVDAVSHHDPLFFKRIEDPIPLESTQEYRCLEALGRLEVSSEAKAFTDYFDAGLEGGVAKLVGYKPNGEALLASSVRHVLGLLPTAMSDDDAIATVLAPSQNAYLGNTLNLNSIGKLTRALAHVHLTFQKKLSHSADSQDQRHRMAPGSRPVLQTHYAPGHPDVIVPDLITQNPQALDRFMQTAHQTWETIDALLNDGVAAEQALYLLPNAFPIRFEESGDLLALHHKWTTRLCYNAQEEIWRASYQEVDQVRAVYPRIGHYLLPPCGLRKDSGTRPFCPEGPRFCGVPVWKLPFEDYQRLI